MAEPTTGAMTEWLEAQIQDNKFTAFIFYRGVIADAYLQDAKKFVGEIEEMGGKLFALTSQKPKEAAEAKKKWDLNFDCVGDRENELRDYMAEKGWIDIEITHNFLITKGKYGKKGMAQPGVLFITKDHEVMFQWAIRANVMNLGGASDRPVFADIWQQLKSKHPLLGGDGSANDAGSIPTAGAFSFKL